MRRSPRGCARYWSAPAVRSRRALPSSGWNPIAEDEASALGVVEDLAPLQLLDLPEPPETTAATRGARSLDDLRSLLLGFDFAPGDAARTLADYQQARAELVATGEHTAEP